MRDNKILWVCVSLWKMIKLYDYMFVDKNSWLYESLWEIRKLLRFI